MSILISMKPSEMTDEQLRIKVAELLGITDIHPLSRVEYWENWRKFEGWLNLPVGRSESGELIKINDYPNDLNACHEMEKSLDAVQRLQYVGLLHYGTPKNNAWDQEDAADVCMSTARQRCEAFVKVMEGR